MVTTDLKYKFVTEFSNPNKRTDMRGKNLWSVVGKTLVLDWTHSSLACLPAS